MTLIIGIKCETGVVLGADSASTYNTSVGQPTSMQPTRKLQIIEDKIIAGVSGHVGLSQFFTAGIEKLWKEKAFSNCTKEEARIKITETLREPLSREARFADSSRGVINQLSRQELISQTLVALPVRKEPLLLEFTATCASEEKNERLPTVAIGSGQQIADPFLFFLRRVFWPDKLPTIGQAKFAAYWALDYSIKAAPGSVGYPIKIAILEKNGNDLNAFELLDEELTTLNTLVEEAHKHIKNFKPPQ